MFNDSLFCFSLFGGRVILVIHHKCDIATSFPKKSEASSVVVFERGGGATTDRRKGPSKYHQALGMELNRIV